MYAYPLLVIVGDGCLVSASEVLRSIVVCNAEVIERDIVVWSGKYRSLAHILTNNNFTMFYIPIVNNLVPCT